MQIKDSELILNKDGSVYHLNLKPGEIADTILTVGDPERVQLVTAHFDSVELTKRHREFHTQTGMYRGKRLTVLSTGMGAGNIDIVMNELDALVNIDFETRKIKKTLKSLRIIRIGTSGAIQASIPLNKFLVSETAIGFDNLLHFYECTAFLDTNFSEVLMKALQWDPQNATPYVVSGDAKLLEIFASASCMKGITATNIGFYAPQGRNLRLTPKHSNFNENLAGFLYKEKQITNLEMETACIYGLAKLLGHQAISLNVILANRANGTFSDSPKQAIEKLIKYTLERLVL